MEENIGNTQNIEHKSILLSLLRNVSVRNNAHVFPINGASGCWIHGSSLFFVNRGFIGGTYNS